MKRINTHSKSDLPFFLSIPALVWQCLFFLVPLTLVVFFSVVPWTDVTYIPTLTLKNYAALFTFEHVRIFSRSVFLSLGTATMCLFLAYPIAYFLALRVSRWKNFFLFLITLPFWANFLILVYAWFFLLDHNGLINNALIKIGLIKTPLEITHNLFAVSVVMVYCYLPFMILPIYSSLTKIKERLLEASLDLGATPWQTLANIIIPLSVPGIRTGFLLVMVPSFGELAIPTLLGKKWTLGPLLAHYFFVMHDNGLGAAATLLGGFVLLCVVLIMYRILSIPLHVNRGRRS